MPREKTVEGLKSVVTLLQSVTEHLIVLTIPPIPRLAGNTASLEALKDLNTNILAIPPCEFGALSKKNIFFYGFLLINHACLFQLLILTLLIYITCSLKAQMLRRNCLSKYSI